MGEPDPAGAVPGKREVCFLVDRGGEVLWSDDSGAAAALADSRERWEAIWRHRRELSVIAHSHPVGPLAFSHEDETTMRALEVALGFAPAFAVLAPAGLLLRRVGREDEVLGPEPTWAATLRALSGMARRTSAGGE